MILKVYSIYDTGISTWLKPIYAKNNGEIIRSFIEACSDSNSQFCKHPSDYTLFELGEWDDDSCKFSLLSTPNRIAMAIDFAKPVSVPT